MDPATIANQGLQEVWSQTIAIVVMALVIIGLAFLLMRERKDKREALIAERLDKNKAVEDRNEVNNRFIDLAEKNIETQQRLATLIEQQIQLSNMRQQS